VPTRKYFGIRDFLSFGVFLGPTIISDTIDTHFYHKGESVNILKFKLNIHIAAITIPHNGKPSLFYIHRLCISMGLAYKLP
jgi:hypothetical protein